MKNKLLTLGVILLVYYIYTLTEARLASPSRTAIGAGTIVTLALGLLQIIGGKGVMKIFGVLLLIITFPIWGGLLTGLFGAAFLGSSFARFIIIMFLGIMLLRFMVSSNQPSADPFR